MIEKDFIKYIAEQIVDKPNSVKVDHTTDENGVLLKLWVDKGDLGRIIGSHGDTTAALRNLLRALGTKNNEHYYLKIVDTDKEPAQASDAVENTSSENVENTDDRLKNLKKGIAEINDLDI